MTEQDFKDWRASPATKLVFNTIVNRILEIQDNLGRTAGYNSVDDARQAGAIQAYKDLLEIDFEEFQ